jgi:hypothetical protein
MTTNTGLIKRIDFDKILPMSRYAGGHDEQMKGLLKNVKVLSHWNEGDYSGSVATMVQLRDTKEVVIYSDYYGSCSGCDSWEDAGDTSVREMCKQLASTARIFKNKKEALSFLKTPREEGKDFGLSDDVRNGLLQEYQKKGD